VALVFVPALDRLQDLSRMPLPDPLNLGFRCTGRRPGRLSSRRRSRRAAGDLLAVDGAAVHQAGDGESIQPKVTGPVREFRVDVGERMGDRFLPCSSPHAPCAARGALVAECGGDEVTGLAQGRENEVGVGTDGGGGWAVSAVGSGARVPKRRMAAPCNTPPGKPPPPATAGGPEPHSPCSRI
jgi:hypothetical protein